MRERAAWCVLTVILLVAVVREHRTGPGRAVHDRPRTPAGVRISMSALHQQGGVPLGWQLTLPPGDPVAGRRVFVDLGCHACHPVTGEAFSERGGDRPGPDLAGMGIHHPPAYFAEAILNPDAVLVDAPGYIGDDGHSIMPTYPEMTAGELDDLVAYLTSLQGDTTPSGGSPAVTMSSLDLRNRPAPQMGEARAFFAQTYDVLPGQLAPFEAWFATRGREQFLAVDGLVGIDTFVDAARAGGAMTSLFRFRDEAALRNFMGDPATADPWKAFDAFLGPHGHLATDRPLVYRAPSLSTD